MAISLQGEKLLVATCTSLDAVTFYDLRVRREGQFGASYARLVSLEGDGVELPAGYEYVAGELIEGMALVESSEADLTGASAIEVSISGGSGIPPEHVLRELPIPLGGLVPGQWVRFDGTVHAEACEEP